jgi:putative phosphoesterase
MIPEDLKECLIGVISDTHGRITRPLAEVLSGVDLIIHAGDIDNSETLEALMAIAPVVAVRGNMDRGNWSRGLHKSELIEIGEVILYVIHNLEEMDIDPESINVSAVISGHTHRSSLKQQGPVLFVNPGSATHPRDHQPPSVVMMRISARKVNARLKKIPGRQAQ